MLLLIHSPLEVGKYLVTFLTLMGTMGNMERLQVLEILSLLVTIPLKNITSVNKIHIFCVMLVKKLCMKLRCKY